ncbi:helix-turn-helix transcriptional regulator [bacterium]|nr:helix-turn-helix transcriptional regulator [bacterium]
MPAPETIIALAETFKALADPSRTRILFALSRAELCVCDLAELLGLSVSAISHQLRHLRELKLVKYRREGKMAYYSLDDDHVKTLFRQGLAHVEEGR